MLSRHVTIKVDELDYATHLTIEQTGIWLECEPRELTIGYGLAHRHYDPEHDDLRPALDRLFNLLTKRKRITLYSKREKVFKEKTELQLGEERFEQLGVAMTWMFPFWQLTTSEVKIEEPLITYSEIENEIRDIYKLLSVDNAPSA